MQIVDKQLLEIREKFRDFYNQNLIDDYKELEKNRKKQLLRFIVLAIIGVFVCGLLNSFLDRDGVYTDNEVKAFVAVVCFFYVILYGIYNNFLKATKQAVMDKILSFFGNMKYGKSDIHYSCIDKSELFPNFDFEEIDDCFKGSYEEVNINVSEHKLIRGTGKRAKTIFKGIFILFDFNKKFKGKTVVYSNNIINNTFSCVKGKKVDVNLEDVVFSKEWKVKATDQIEARYVLTPMLMEQMLKIKKLFKGVGIEFSFFDNKLFIAIPTYKNLFETTSLFSSALGYHRVQNVIYQFYCIFSIVKILKLKKDDN